MARRAYAELLDVGSLHVDVLLVGSDISLAGLLDLLRPQFRHPICCWRPDQALVLPDPWCGGTLILRDLGAMSSGQQATLFGWLNDARYTRVVSTSSAPVWPDVHAGMFMPALYYRLNNVVIKVT